MADRYWVGGTANWDATAGTKWALTSGGAGGQAVPTASDDVYIDSGSGAVTVTTSGARVCKSLKFVSGAGAFSGTFAGSAGVTISGDLVLSASMTNSSTNPLTFNSTTSQTITTNGKTSDCNFTFNGVGGSWALQDALTTGATRQVVLTNGTLNLNNKNLTCGTFSSSNSNTRTLAYGTGQIYLTGSATTIYSGTTATGLTITGTPIVNCTYSGSTGNRQINGGATATLPEAQSISFNITAGTDTIVLGGSNCFKNVDFTGFKGTVNSSSASAVTIYGNLTFDSGCNPSFAAGTTLTFASTSGTNTITCAGTTIGTNIAFTGLGGTWQFADALTLASTKTINFTNGTLRLKAGVTSTVYGFTASGTTQKYLESTTLGSQATLSDPSGTVSVSYVTIKDINATGGATWNAYVTNNNVNSGNNTGWDFYLPVTSIYDSLRLRGYTGTVTDMLLQYYKANGATSNSLQDAESEFLILKGFTSGSNTDKWYAYLRSLSFTGTVTDMSFEYWKDPA